MSSSARGPARCPFCDGRETELANAFGAHASVSSWWCRDCRSPFEMFKWGNHPDERGFAPPTPAFPHRPGDASLGHEEPHGDDE